MAIGVAGARRGVTGALRLADDEQAIDQLEALVGLENAELDEAVVLGARPAPEHRRGRQGGLHRCVEHTDRARAHQCLGYDPSHPDPWRKP